MSLHCPYCNGTEFKAIVKRPALIDLSGDELVIKKEINTPETTFYEVQVCKSCNAKLTNEDLVSTVKCSACGKQVSSSDLVGEVCLDCFMEAHPEFKKLSMAQLIRKVVELQSSTKDAPSKKEDSKPEQKAPAKEEVPKNVPSNDAASKEDKKEDTPSNNEAEQPARRRRRRVEEETPKDETPKEEKKDEVPNEPNEPKKEVAAGKVKLTENTEIAPPEYEDDPFA